MMGRALRWRHVACVGLSVLAEAGCAGGGRVFLVELQTRTISESQPLIPELTIVEAYWWEDTNGHIRVAARAKPQGLRPGTFWLRLELSEPPAGSAREYSLNRDRLKAFYSVHGLPQSRLASFRGIAALWPQPGGTMKGRLRVWVRHQRYTLLLGWRSSAQVLITGEFHALHDAARGAALRPPDRDTGWTAPKSQASPTTRPVRSSPPT